MKTSLRQITVASAIALTLISSATQVSAQAKEQYFPLRADVVHDGRDLAVGVELQREDVGKNATIGRIGAAVVDGDQRQFVGSGALQCGVSDADRQRVGGGGGGTVQARLQTLIALHAFFHHFGGGIENWFPYLLALLFLLYRPFGLFGERTVQRI